jgi:hypothetical protein
MDVSHHKPVQKHEHDIPRAPCPRGGGTPRGYLEQMKGPGPGENAGSFGSAVAVAGASAGASGTSLGGQKHSLPNRMQARVQQRGWQGSRKERGRSGRGAPPWCKHPPEQRDGANLL